MAQAPFIPSAAPHSVEMPQGSAIAKSRSGSTGTDIRRAEQDHLAPDQAIQLEPHHIVLQGGAVATGLALAQKKKHREALDAALVAEGRDPSKVGILFNVTPMVARSYHASFSRGLNKQEPRFTVIAPTTPMA